LDTTETLSPWTRLLHWAVAALIAGLLGVGLYMVHWEAWAWYPIHKSFGILAGVVICIRVLWRWRAGWPPPVREIGPIEARIVHVAHVVLLCGTLAMPLSGLLFSASSGHGIAFFGLDLFPPNPQHGADGDVLPYSTRWSDFAQATHALLGYFMIAAIALHVLAALKHHLVDRDATLLRMLGRRSA
jgi:cytochrome b561